MRGIMTPETWLLVLLSIAVLIRLSLPRREHSQNHAAGGKGSPSWVICQTMGNQEIQADCALAAESHAGILAVMADGIGKENTGRISAQIAVDTVLDQYEPYQELNNPEYLFQTAFHEANLRIQRTIGERRGGACLAAVFLNRHSMHYALAGDIRIALLRNGELIPISHGQTMDVLAAAAFEDGRLGRKETVWSMEDKRVWNYLGLSGFHEIEVGERPILLKVGDEAVIVSKGVFQELTWAELEDLMAEGGSPNEKAKRIISEVEKKPGSSKENASVIILKAEVANEAD